MALPRQRHRCCGRLLLITDAPLEDAVMSHDHATAMSARERRRLADCKRMAFRRAIEERAEQQRLQQLLDGYAGLMAQESARVPAAAGC